MGKKQALTLAEGDTHVAMLKNQCKVAFTLAEVLITLGIIGVVAALTMPVLIANYQNKELLTRIKKTYSTFTNAVNLALAEAGTPDNITVVFDTSKTSLQTTERMQKYFNGAILCTTRSNNCPYYQIKAQYGQKNPVTGENQYQSGIDVPYLILPDGSIFKFYQNQSCLTVREAQSCKKDSSGNIISNSDGTDCEYETKTWTDNRCAMVQIDANGIKQPNQFGADNFQIGIHEDGTMSSGSGLGDIYKILSTNKLDYKRYNVSE